MLISLKLENFKKHAQLSVDFTTGTNGIYGPNYRGKTTLLYGILFALGGSSHVPGTRLQNIHSDGRMAVELRFRIGADDYLVRRTKSSATLYKGGVEEAVAASHSAVTSKVEELIGMTVRQWKELHYAKQKNAHSLLRYSATNLQQLLRRLVGAEELDQIQQRLKLLVTREQGAAEATRVDPLDIEHLQAAVAVARSDLAGLERRRDEAGAELARLKEGLEQARSAFELSTERAGALQRRKAKAELHAQRLEAARRGQHDAVRVLEERLAAQRDADIAALEFAGLDPQASRQLIADVQANARARRAAQQDVEEAREAASTADRKVEFAELEVQQKVAAQAEHLQGSSLEELEQQEYTLKNRHRELTLAVRSLQNAADGASCPTCRRPMEGHDPEELARELAAARGELKRFEEEELNPVGRRADAARRLGSELIGLRNKAELAVAKAAQAEAEFAKVNTRFSELGAAGLQLAAQLGDRSLAELSTELERAEQAGRRLAQAEALVASARAALSAAEQALEAVEGQESEDPALLASELEGEARQQAELRQQVTTLGGQVKAAADVRDTLRQECAGMAAGVQSGQARLEDLLSRQAKHDSVARRLAKLQHLQKCLKQNSEGYMAKVWASFMAQSSRWASLCTGGDIERLDRTEDGSFSFTEAGQEMQLEEASGAQEAIIGLAVQLALASTAPCHLNVLLLDEPTADMDADRSLATIAALGALGQQVVFVSHHQTDNAVCNNAIVL